MLMAKRLLNASFYESTKIVHNLFAENQKWYDSGAKGSQNIGARIFNIIPWILFSGIAYALGVGLPETASDRTVKLGLSDVWYGASKFYFMKHIFLGIIIAWGLLLLINIIPKPNYLFTRLFEIGNLVFMILLMTLALTPMLLGTTLGATGWFGFIIICVYGLSFFFSCMTSRINNIKQELYKKSIDKQSSYSSKIWAFLKKVWLVPFALLLINIFTFRLGMRGNFTLWSFIWMFAGPIYFGILTLFSVGPMKMFVSSFYFAKYAEEYRILWKVTDEQWYGKRKARKIVKKNLKQERKGK